MEKHELRTALAAIIVAHDGRSEGEALAWADAELRRRGGGGWQRLGEVLAHCSDPASPFSAQTRWTFYGPAPLPVPTRQL